MSASDARQSGQLATGTAQRLSGKVVVVTGGGSGIGLGIARCCAREGALLVLAQRRAHMAEQAAAELRAQGFEALALGCDVSKRADVQALIAAAVARWGRLDVMVNNAALTGAAAATRPFLAETDEHWRELIDINLTGAFICTQEAAKQMVAQGGAGGSIITISSVAQYAAQELAAPYCASKAALDGLTKAAAIELAQYGIRVNNVAPGDIDTAASADVAAHAAAQGASGSYARVTPLRRRGRPEEVGHVVAFLASEEAAFVTGATWLVDGGFLSY